MHSHPICESSWRSDPVSNLRILFLSFVLFHSSPAVAEWPQFRGPNATGISIEPVPTHFGPDLNEFWRLKVGAGHSSPIISGESIFLTNFDKSKKQLGVVAIEKDTGTIRWEKSLQVEQLEKGHPSFNPASSTPVTDGERVVAYFGSYGLLCFDFEGNLLWENRLPLTKSYAGNAVSPIIVGNKVILYRGNFVDHFLLALDKVSGEQIWKTEQAEPFNAELACTAVPVVHEQTLILHSARSVQGFDIESGEELWVAKCATTATSSPLVVNDRVIVAAWNKMGEPVLRPEFPSFEELLANHDANSDGLIQSQEYPKLWIFHRPEGIEAPQNGATIRFGSVDRDKDGHLNAAEWTNKLADLARFREGYKNHGLLSLPTEKRGALESTDVLTLESQGIPEVPSPISDGQFVYLVKNGGLLTCIDLNSGKRSYRIRTGGRGTHYASPIIAGEFLYIADGSGSIAVIKLGDSPQIISNNDLGEPVYSTPAADGGTLYVRTHTTLFAFKDSDSPGSE